MISDHNKEAAENRAEYYEKLIEAVEASNMGSWDKHRINEALRVLAKPHTGSRSAEEWVRRLTMIEKGKRIHTEKMKPCPYCGCGMELEETMMCDLKTIRYDPVPIKKHKRGCQLEYTGSAFTGQPETITAAIEKWNRRTNGDG